MSNRDLTISRRIAHPLEIPIASIDVQIRIRRMGARYEADIFTAGNTQKVDLDISPADLEVLNMDIRKPIRGLLKWENKMWTPTKKEIQKLLRPLAEAGHFAFEKIFGSPSAKKAIEEILSFEEQLCFQISSEDFYFPWELLYHEKLKNIAVNNFWGLQFIISRIIVKPFQEGRFSSMLIRTKGLPNIGLVCNQRLRGVKDKEIPFFEQLDQDNLINLSQMQPLDVADWDQEIYELKEFLDQQYHLLHFACHASFEDDSPLDSFISISDNYKITLKHMVNYGLKVNNQPLIFLNACETTNINPLQTFHFANAFLDCGARGVVVTDFMLPDNFAAGFAGNFYKLLLKGMPLGESLLEIRKAVASKDDNPLGLLYSMYASPGIRLESKNNGLS